MAKLVSVIRSDQYLFERRQLPLECDDALSLVMQLDDTCMGCSKESLKRKELERFVNKFHALSSDELAVALMVTSKTLVSLLQQMVPCVGCRRSVERLLKQLEKSGHPSLEPLVITPSGSISIRREYLFDPKAVFALFYIHGAKMSDVMESIPKSKKNKRCNLHSLDTHTHKTKTLGVWEDAWTVLSQECREEVLLIEFDALLKTLENYLRKHRFCTECKSKVMRAYDILIGDVDGKSEKGYVAALFDGLRCCAQERHIHVSSKSDYVSCLISRAEPELTGSRRERHAKTLDIAQEEVLTCLGIHLYERLYKINQNLRAEEQTWQILLFLGMDALRKSFDVALETKQGRSNLELVCEELQHEEQLKEAKRELKRLKRRKKKNDKATSLLLSSLTNNTSNGVDDDNKGDDDDDNGESKECHCDENTNDKRAQCNYCDVEHGSAEHAHSNCAFRTRAARNNQLNSGVSTRDCVSRSRPACSGCDGGGGGSGGNNAGGGGSCCDANNSTPVPPPSLSSPPPHSCSDSQPNSPSKLSSSHNDIKQPQQHLASPACNHSDVGYGSGPEGSENCSSSSPDGSDVACHEGLCNHDGDTLLCDRADVLLHCKSCDAQTKQSPKHAAFSRHCDTNSSTRNGGDGTELCYTSNCDVSSSATVLDERRASPQQQGASLTLQDMLEGTGCSSGDECCEEEFLTEEEIKQFKANEGSLRHQRDQLRVVLRQRFASMQTRLSYVWPSTLNGHDE